MALALRKGKKDDTGARTVAAVRSDIEQLEAQRAELERQRDALIDRGAQKIMDGTPGEELDAATRLSTQIAMMDRKLTLLQKQLYAAGKVEIVDAYRQARAMRWGAVAQANAAKQAAVELQERYERELKAMRRRANQASHLAQKAEDNAKQLVALRVQMLGLDVDDQEALFAELHEPLALIDAEFGGGCPQDYKPPADIARVLAQELEQRLALPE